MNCKDIHLLGISYRTAPLATREALSFDRVGAHDFLRKAVAESPELEAVILSTCNRTEFYLACQPGSQAVDRWLERVREERPIAPALYSECARYRKQGGDAVRHLFEVASGLDSAILGDSQILGQVKQAMTSAAEAGSLHGFLRRAFTQAIRTGKRARTTTNIGHGTASLGSVLVRILEGRIARGRFAQTPRILIIGAGEIARDIGRNLAKRKIGLLHFINRTEPKAKSLAIECGGAWSSWIQLEEALISCDIVIAATASSRPVLEAGMLTRIAKEKSSAFEVIVDAGSPRNVEPGSGVPIMDLDSIREVQSAALIKRQAAIPAVHRIVEEELQGWSEWYACQPLESIIKALYVQVPFVSQSTADSLVSAGTLNSREIERALSHSINRLLHDHVTQLRERWPIAAIAAAS